MGILIIKNWDDCFKSIFGKDTNYWKRELDYLSKVRNPMAHNREVLEDFEKQIADGYCKEILDKISYYEVSKLSDNNPCT